jgi:hypothetical protein
MGATFIHAMAEVSKPKEHWLNILGELNDGEIMEYVQATDETHDWESEWAYIEGFDKDDAPTFAQTVAERLTEAINVCYDVEHNPQLGWFRIDDWEFVITGGMSWGDNPTDYMADVEMFDSFQLWLGERS